MLPPLDSLVEFFSLGFPLYRIDEPELEFAVKDLVTFTFKVEPEDVCAVTSEPSKFCALQAAALDKSNSAFCAFPVIVDMEPLLPSNLKVVD